MNHMVCIGVCVGVCIGVCCVDVSCVQVILMVVYHCSKPHSSSHTHSPPSKHLHIPSHTLFTTATVSVQVHNMHAACVSPTVHTCRASYKQLPDAVYDASTNTTMPADQSDIQTQLVVDAVTLTGGGVWGRE